jgi:hypothetical protein
LYLNIQPSIPFLIKGIGVLNMHIQNTQTTFIQAGNNKGQHQAEQQSTVPYTASCLVSASPRLIEASRQPTNTLKLIHSAVDLQINELQSQLTNIVNRNGLEGQCSYSQSEHDKTQEHIHALQVLKARNFELPEGALKIQLSAQALGGASGSGANRRTFAEEMKIKKKELKGELKSKKELQKIWSKALEKEEKKLDQKTKEGDTLGVTMLEFNINQASGRLLNLRLEIESIERQLREF